MNPLTQLKKTTALLVIPLAFVCFALVQNTQAVVPAPDGGYPNNNTAEGDFALLSLTTGADNTAVGLAALGLNLVGSDNTALGTAALLNNTASNNTAIGSLALFHNTDGTQNTATGFAALFSNTTISGNSGNDNTAIGFEALASNTTGDSNTATGFGSLFSNTTGGNNTAVGSQALASNTQSSNNTAVGPNALASNLGGGNSAFGVGALQFKQLGAFNTAMGINALNSLTAGDNNTAVGLQAGQHLTTGNGNAIMGFQAGTNLTMGNGNIYIANPGAASESNTIRIGNAQVATFIAGINGVDEGNPTAVFINTTTGQLGTTPPPSSRQYKKEIKPMDKVSETILALKPVTFHYKSDQAGTPQFGLIAEEVAEANRDLVIYDRDGKPYTVRYDAVNAMLLNEFLKDHRKVQEQEAAITQLKKDFGATIAQLTARLDEQAAQIQKGSAQIEASKPAPQVVKNP